MKKSTAELLGLLEELDEYLTSGEPVEDPLKLFQEVGVMDAVIDLPEIQSTPSLVNATFRLVGSGGHKIDAIVWTRRIAQRLRHGEPEASEHTGINSIWEGWEAYTSDGEAVRHDVDREAVRRAFDGTGPELTVEVHRSEAANIKRHGFVEGQITIGKSWANIQIFVEWLPMKDIVFGSSLTMGIHGAELQDIADAVALAWEKEGLGSTEQGAVGAVTDRTLLAGPDSKETSTWIDAVILETEEHLYEQNKANIQKSDEIIEREARAVVSKRKPKKRKKKGP